MNANNQQNQSDKPVTKPSDPIVVNARIDNDGNVIFRVIKSDNDC